ncbi:MAG: hypothetical protein AAFX79_12655 [Planctomycetota bacterium]
MTPQPDLVAIHRLRATDEGGVLAIGSQGAAYLAESLRQTAHVVFDRWPPGVDRRSLRPNPTSLVRETKLDEDPAWEFVDWSTPGFTFAFRAVDDDGGFLWSRHVDQPPLLGEGHVVSLDGDGAARACVAWASTVYEIEVRHPE